MKVALFVHCFFPNHYYGTEVYTLTVAKELVARGHEPVVVTARFPGEPAQQQMIEEYSWDGIRVISIDKNAMPHRAVRDTYDQPALTEIHRNILQQIKPDIVHVCHLINHTTALIHAASALGLPIVATLTDFFGFCFTNQLEAADGSLCAGPAPSRANCVTCYLKATGPVPTSMFGRAILQLAQNLSSQFLARAVSRSHLVERIFKFSPQDLVARPQILAEAMRAYRIAFAPSLFLKNAYERNEFPAPLVLSHFGVDIDRSAKPTRHPGRPIHIGYIGQIAPHKGVHHLVEALKAAGRPNLSVSIWGPNNQAPAYFRNLVDASRGANVHFAGTFPLDSVAKVLADVDVLVIPSTWYENSPMILLQALATHTPVIVSDVEGMTEFVEHGRNGFHFARGNSAALAAVLRRIADEEGLIETMSRQTEYRRTSSDMVNDLLASYDSVLRMEPSQHIGLAP